MKSVVIMAINTAIGIALVFFTQEMADIALRESSVDKFWLRSRSTIWIMRLGGAVLLAAQATVFIHYWRHL